MIEIADRRTRAEDRLCTGAGQQVQAQGQHRRAQQRGGWVAAVEPHGGDLQAALWAAGLCGVDGAFPTACCTGRGVNTQRLGSCRPTNLLCNCGLRRPTAVGQTVALERQHAVHANARLAWRPVTAKKRIVRRRNLFRMTSVYEEAAAPPLGQPS